VFWDILLESCVDGVVLLMVRDNGTAEMDRMKASMLKVSEEVEDC
jgi:hypothetical protein